MPPVAEKVIPQQSSASVKAWAKQAACKGWPEAVAPLDPRGLEAALAVLEGLVGAPAPADHRACLRWRRYGAPQLLLPSAVCVASGERGL